MVAHPPRSPSRVCRRPSSCRARSVPCGRSPTAGALGFYALGALTACFIAALSEVFDVWLAALVVTAVYGLLAAILAWRGKAKVQQATPPVPERAMASVKEDVRFTKQRAHEARHPEAHR